MMSEEIFPHVLFFGLISIPLVIALYLFILGRRVARAREALFEVLDEEKRNALCDLFYGTGDSIGKIDIPNIDVDDIISAHANNLFMLRLSMSGVHDNIKELSDPKEYIAKVSK